MESIFYRKYRCKIGVKIDVIQRLWEDEFGWSRHSSSFETDSFYTSLRSSWNELWLLILETSGHEIICTLRGKLRTLYYEAANSERIRSQLNWTQYTGPWFKSQTQTRESTMNWQRPTTAGPPVSWNGKRTQSRPGWVDLFYDQNRPNWIPWYTVCHWLIPSSNSCTEPYCL